jgi:hypothetical protein
MLRKWPLILWKFTAASKPYQIDPIFCKLYLSFNIKYMKLNQITCILINIFSVDHPNITPLQCIQSRLSFYSLFCLSRHSIHNTQNNFYSTIFLFGSSWKWFFFCHHRHLIFQIRIFHCQQHLIYLLLEASLSQFQKK